MGGEAGAEALLADLEQLAVAGTWVLELDSGALTWSEGLRRLHGVERGAVRSMDGWAELVHIDDRALWRRTLDEAVDRGQGYAIDHRIVRAGDGTVRWLRSRARLDAGSLLGVTVDTTAEHDASETLRTFLADAAHELRTPASAIGQAATVLGQVDGAERDAVLSVIARQAARLRVLATDLVDLAQLEAGSNAIVLEAVPLAAAVAAAVEHAPPPIGHDVSVEVPDSLDVIASGGHLDRVFVNLLTNAYRYGGPRVHISARVEDQRVVIEVADDGDGVPVEAVDGLFHAFRPGPQRHAEASGLGLAIVANLVRRFGGGASYHPGNPGAVFVLDLEQASGT